MYIYKQNEEDPFYGFTLLHHLDAAAADWK